MAKKKTTKMMMTDAEMKRQMGHTMAEHLKEYGGKMPPKSMPPKGMMKTGGKKGKK